MKKAKILLAAVAVFGVVGGISAVKALESEKVFTHKASDPVGICTEEVKFRTLEFRPNQVPLNTYATEIPGNCDIVNVYTSL